VLNMKTELILLLMLSVIVIAGCSAPPTNPGMANPASVYCAEQGGSLDIVETGDGQIGVCHLRSGKICEEWAYYRGECPAKDCGECPMLSTPGPNFCPNGKIVAGDLDQCGCRGAPRCEQIACTMEAKLCPDGVTYVGRQGPNCEFAACPG
jgi:uncharacterized protein